MCGASAEEKNKHTGMTNEIHNSDSVFKRARYDALLHENAETGLPNGVNRDKRYYDPSSYYYYYDYYYKRLRGSNTDLDDTASTRTSNTETGTRTRTDTGTRTDTRTGTT